MEAINITKSVEPTKAEPQYKERWPVFKSGEHVTVRHTAKVDLFYLDGTTNCIKIILPVMSAGSEELPRYLKSYTCRLISQFLPASHYQISLGSIDKDNNEEYCIICKMEEVPLGKVWVNNMPLGMWMEPQKIEEGRWKIDEIRPEGGRGPYPFPYNESWRIVEPTIY